MADGLGPDQVDDVSIIDVGHPPGGRLGRMLIGSFRMWRNVAQLQPDVVHFHDPELIPLGILIRARRIPVIYDIHEDLPAQILYKHWLPVILRRPLSLLARLAEGAAAFLLSHLVPATPIIARRFPAHKTTVVKNLPLPAELVDTSAAPYETRPSAFAYVGGIFDVRGIYEMTAAINLLGAERPDVQLILAGPFFPSGLAHHVQQLPGWRYVRHVHWAHRPQVRDILSTARAGLVLLHPVDNLKHAYPVKLFEYMAAGLPVIASDFPLWRDILTDIDCALFVDPLDPMAIADAMRWLLDNPSVGLAMGARGRAAVNGGLNWTTEAERLVAVYDKAGRT